MSKLCKGRSLLAAINDYTAVDIETTGLNPASCEIIEISAVKVRDGQVVETFSQLVKPVCPVDGFISDLTGITNEMLADQPDISEVYPRFHVFLGDDLILGHNVSFDISFLNAANLALGGPGLLCDYVDTLRVSRRLFPEMPHHRLSDLVCRCGIQNDQEHRALSDAMATKECYDYMLRIMREKGISSEDLAKCRCR